jgi:hypothetical protein
LYGDTDTVPLIAYLLPGCEILAGEEVVAGDAVVHEVAAHVVHLLLVPGHYPEGSLPYKDKKLIEGNAKCRHLTKIDL